MSRISHTTALPASQHEPRQRAHNNRFESWIETHSDVAAVAVVVVGLIARLKTASGTFLNPDEALHFFIANRPSWALAYQASLTMAHPPLLIFVLYWWRHLGTSELMLRLPSVIAGTAFCWIFFQWVKRTFGSTVALMCVIFSALLQPMVALSAEVRQYELLLFFLISGSYWLERAFVDDSSNRLLLSAACLYLAMLSHYSGFLFAASLAVYAALRIIRFRPSAQFAITWIFTQLGALALVFFLYQRHISSVRNTTMAAQAHEDWLYKSYFHPGHGHVWVFSVTRTFSLFQYLMGQLAIGDLAALLFIAGVMLLSGNIIWQKQRLNLFQVRCLLILPFVLNCCAGLAGVYPYGGTRHSVFLVMPALVGACMGLKQITRGRTSPAIALAVVTVLACYTFPTIHHNEIPRSDQSRIQMQRAVAFVREEIPPSAPILVDYETGLELGHYLCERRSFTYEDSVPGFRVFHCGSHRIISTIPDIWSFGSPSLEVWNRFVRRAGFNPGDTVWVAQAGWIVTLADTLERNSSGFQEMRRQDFGHNIVFFKVGVK